MRDKRKIGLQWLAWRKLPVLIALIFSCILALLGFTTIGMSRYLATYQYEFFFLSLGVLFMAVGIHALRVNGRKGTRLLLFAMTMLFTALFAGYLPQDTDLGGYGLSASFSDNFLLSLGMTIFGLTGTALALGALYDFSPMANQKSAYLFLTISILLVLYPLVIIIGQIVINGSPGITWDFLTQDVRHLGEEGGILPAIMGTLMLMGLVFLIAVPLGVGSAIYLVEYAGGHFIVGIIETAVAILRGVPSVVFGLFAYSFFVPVFGKTFLTGGLTLACYALPLIIRSSSEAIKSVPQGLREGSYALGATKWQTIRHVTLPVALPGMITGMILGIGEAAGETAPLLFIFTFSLDFPPGLFDMVTSLATHLFSLFKIRGAWDVMQNAWATALVFLLIILAMNAIAIVIREKYRKEF